MMGDAFGPRSRPTGRAALRLAGIAASIAIAGCEQQPLLIDGASRCVETEEAARKHGKRLCTQIDYSTSLPAAGS